MTAKRHAYTIHLSQEAHDALHQIASDAETPEGLLALVLDEALQYGLKAGQAAQAAAARAPTLDELDDVGDLARRIAVGDFSARRARKGKTDGAR